jgi:hypothetical protein
MDVKDCQDAALVLGLYVQPGYFPEECCDSCHDDIGEGYPLSEIEVAGIEYEVCCRIAERLHPSVDA